MGTIRLIALHEGISNTGTLVRLDALHITDYLSTNKLETLTDVFHVITRLLQHQQRNHVAAYQSATMCHQIT